MGRRNKRARAPSGTPAAGSKPVLPINSPKDTPDSSKPAAAYSPLVAAGLRATTTRVQEMHQAIAATTFDALGAVPVLSLPSMLVQGAHDAISDAVYAGVRHGGTALMSVAARVEQASSSSDATSPNGAVRLRNALNAAVGDSLQAASNPLAIAMELLVDGAPVLGDAAALQDLGPRVAVFVHGLGCDERSWSRDHPAWSASAWSRRGRDYPSLLKDDAGMSAVHVRYNSGLAIADNAAQLAEQLSTLVEAAPLIERFVIVGHSMGGLVARSACEIALADRAPWGERASLLVCLGSPHRGAPLERLGQLASAALSVSKITQPLARIAQTRSRGIKDLRRGLRDHAPRCAVPLRLVSGNLAADSDSIAARLVGSLLGDGLVPRGSSHDPELSGDVQRVELHGVGHMALLSHPRVYELILGWISEVDARPLD